MKKHIIYNSENIILSIHINDEKLLQEMKSHYLAYNLNKQSKSLFLQNSCIVTSTLIKSLLSNERLTNDIDTENCLKDIFLHLDKQNVAFACIYYTEDLPTEPFNKS